MIQGGPLSRIFLSYRREDSSYPADRLYQKLTAHFGKDNIFKDIDTIAYGVNFRQVIADKVGSCDALIAVIGKAWLDVRDKNGRRRLDDPLARRLSNDTPTQPGTPLQEKEET